MIAHGLKIALATLALLVSPASTLAADDAQQPPAPPAAPAPSARASKAGPKEYPTFGQIEKLDPALDALIPPGTMIEKLAGGFEWAEGPVWRRKTKTLLFSDVPQNVVFEWKEGAGTRDFLLRSGFAEADSRTGEPGANGLTLDSQGRLVLCQHGDRQVSRLNDSARLTVHHANGQAARTNLPGSMTTLAAYYNSRQFNSPNDLVFRSNGDLYFTDPSYGLVKGDTDPEKELFFNGVYLLRSAGDPVLLTKELAFPNGLAFSPDEKTLYISVSDPAKPVIMAYAVATEGTLAEGKVFFDASGLTAGRKGLPDGLKVDLQGNLFAAGPGGILVLSPTGKHLGTIHTGEATSNCAWGDNGSTLYITADMFLCRIKTATKGRLP